MTSTVATSQPTDDLRRRLAAALSRGSLDLTDDLLGFPLLTDLLGTGLTVRSTKLGDPNPADTSTGGVTLTGKVDVLGAKAVTLELVVEPDPEAPTADLRLALPAAASWDLPGLALTGIELVVHLSGNGPARMIAGALTATSGHGPIELSVVVPGGARPWVLGLRVEGALLAVLPELVGDAWAQVVGGDGAPVADLSAVERVDLTVDVDPATRSVERVTVDLAAPSWPLTERVALTDLAVHLAVEHPGEADRRSVELTVDAAVTADTVRVPVRIARRATGGWDLALATGNGDTPPTLPQLLAAFGGPELAAAMPSELAELPAVRLGDLAAGITGGRLEHLSLTVFADWEVLPGRLALRAGTASVDVTDPTDAATRRVALHIAGTADVFGVSVEIAADKDADAPLTLRGGLAPGTVASLHTVLAQTVGSVPPEVPDVTVTLATVTLTPQTGALTIDAACAVPWALPFGVPGLLVGRTELHLDRAPDTAPGVHALLTASVTLTGSGTVGICDGLDVTGLAMSFVHDAGWVLSGALDVTVLDHAYTLGARLTATPTSRTFEFWEQPDVPADPAAVDLGVGTLSLAGVSIQVSRGTAGGLALDPTSAYAWQLRVGGHAELAARAVVLDGSVELRGAPGSVALTLAPAEPGGSLAELDVPLPAAESVHLHVTVDELTLTRTATSWSASAGAGLWFSGLPGDAARVLPSTAASRLAAHLDLRTGADAAVAVVVERPLPVQNLDLGTLEVEGRSIDLGSGALELHSVELRWRQAGGLEVAVEIGIGLPAALDDILGAGVFLTYDPARPDSLVRLRLSATTDGPALEVTALTSAVHGLTLTPVHPDRPDDPDRQATLRLGDYGTLTFQVPSVGYRTGTFRAEGGFTQRDLALPLAPLRWVLDALGLAALNRVVPDRLSLENLSFLDAAGTLHVDALADAIAGPLRDLTGFTATDEVRSALDVLAMRTHRLPERLRPYLGVTIPESFAFDVAATASGGFVGSVGVGEPGAPVDRATTTPVRLLIPGLAATGPVLNGVELWRLSAGEILGGTALLVRADLTLDQFDLLPLAALLAVPDALAAQAPDPSRLTRRLTVRNLVLLVVPEALVAAPVFFDELSVEYRGVEGAELGVALAFPEPELDLGQALSLYHQLTEFFTSPDALLDDDPAPGLDLALTAGPAYLTLPSYLGGATLGDRSATTTISAGASLAHLLNGLKTLRLDELFAALPTDIQAGTLPAVSFGPLTFAGTWRTGTPAGQRRGMVAHVGGTARLGTFAELDAQLDLHSSGTSDIGGGFVVDGRLGPVTMHLDGALAASGAPGAEPTSVLSFDSPSSRIVTPGPNWTPSAFTVEFWLDPSAVADYDQFVSGSDVWGSFVVHTTATGAVYVGTDVATRLTPAELPAGTIQVGRWQHVAVSYDSGVITFYRDGVRLATKAGLTPPQPWTGMHLGISVPGTQITGRIAELRVWDGARSSDAIAGLMSRRATGSEAGLVGCWHLDGPPTAPITDSGPSGWHGIGTALTAAAPSSPVPGPAAGDVVRLIGHSALSLAGRRIFTGTVDVAPGRFLIDGQLDLFPGTSRADMVVSGRLSGVVDGGHVGLHGSATVRLAGLTLAAATVDITTTSVAVHGTWLDAVTTDLTVSTTQVGGATNTALTGIVTGSWVVDTSIGPVFDIITGAKLADAFHLSGSVTLGLRVAVGDSIGFSGTGRAVVTVGGTPVPLDITLSVSPASFDELKQAVLTQIKAAAAAFFRVLFHDGEAWAQGLVQKGFTWLETAGDDTVRALRAFGISTAAQASSVMAKAGFVGDDIGTVLRQGFVTTSDQLLDALVPTGLDVNAIARAVFAGFEAPLHRDLFTATSAVVSMMRGRYGATLMAGVANRAFGLNNAYTIKALRDNGYIGRELVAAATAALGVTTPDEAARLMNAVGVPAKDTAQGLLAVFPSIRSGDVGDILKSAGFPVSDLNGVLRGLGLPTL